MPPKRILILVADVGFGHRSAARAIATALADRYGDACRVDIVNPLNHARTPGLLRRSQAAYDHNVRRSRTLMARGYEVSDTRLSALAIESAFSVMLLDVMREVLATYEPDVIIAVHHYYLAPLASLFALGGPHPPLLTVVTDFVTVHRLWFNEVSDLCLVATNEARELGIRYGLPAEKIRITGIPVNPAIATNPRPREMLRRGLGWQEDLTTALVVGSRRVAHVMAAVDILNHSGLPLQLAVVAGGDDELFEELRATRWHRPVHLYNYVDNMHDLLRASDCTITKAGGLAVSESLAAGLAILLIDVIEGQETGNADHVIAGGAGERAESALDVLRIMCHWLEDDGALLKERAAKARALGHAQAAHDIAGLAWDLAAGRE